MITVENLVEKLKALNKPEALVAVFVAEDENSGNFAFPDYAFVDRDGDVVLIKEEDLEVYRIT